MTVKGEIKMLLVNKWETPDGTILHSKSRHDYVSHLDDNGKIYAVDGGTCYCRTVGPEDMKSLCIFSDDDPEIIRTTLLWGSYGPRGRSLIYKTIAELETDHICAILRTQSALSNSLREVFIYELCYRDVHNLP